MAREGRGGRGCRPGLGPTKGLFPGLDRTEAPCRSSEATRGRPSPANPSTWGGPFPPRGGDFGSGIKVAPDPLGRSPGGMLGSGLEDSVSGGSQGRSGVAARTPHEGSWGGSPALAWAPHDCPHSSEKEIEIPS